MSQEKNIEVGKTPEEGVALACLPSLFNGSSSIKNEKIHIKRGKKNTKWAAKRNYIKILRYHTNLQLKVHGS